MVCSNILSANNLFCIITQFQVKDLQIRRRLAMNLKLHRSVRGAKIIRMKFWPLLYYIYSQKEHCQNSIQIYEIANFFFDVAEFFIKMSFGQTLRARKDTKQALVTEQVHICTWNPIFGYLKSTKKGVKASQKLMKNLVQLAFNQFLHMILQVKPEIRVVLGYITSSATTLPTYYFCYRNSFLILFLLSQNFLSINQY